MKVNGGEPPQGTCQYYYGLLTKYASYVPIFGIVLGPHPSYDDLMTVAEVLGIMTGLMLSMLFGCVSAKTYGDWVEIDTNWEAAEAQRAWLQCDNYLMKLGIEDKPPSYLFAMVLGNALCYTSVAFLADVVLLVALAMCVRQGGEHEEADMINWWYFGRLCISGVVIFTMLGILDGTKLAFILLQFSVPDAWLTSSLDPEAACVSGHFYHGNSAWQDARWSMNGKLLRPFYMLALLLAAHTSWFRYIQNPGFCGRCNPCKTKVAGEGEGPSDSGEAEPTLEEQLLQVHQQSLQTQQALLQTQQQLVRTLGNNIKEAPAIGEMHLQDVEKGSDEKCHNQH